MLGISQLGQNGKHTFLFLAVNNGEGYTKDTVLALKVGSVFCLLIPFIGIVSGGVGSSVTTVLGTVQIKNETDCLLFSK